jgi:hypothetical protein
MRLEVTSVVDGMADASGSYDPEAVFIAGEDCIGTGRILNRQNDQNLQQGFQVE